MEILNEIVEFGLMIYITLFLLKHNLSDTVASAITWGFILFSILRIIKITILIYEVISKL